jgi:hypothetical protein
MNYLVLLVAILSMVPRWAAAADSPSPAVQPAGSLAPTDSQELARLYAEDQSDRKIADGQAIDWKVVGPRDEARQARVKELYRSDQLRTGADYYHAAMVLQHGQAPEDFLLCHELCIAAIIKGSQDARWLAAASEDRFLMNIGRPQRFGTQFRSMGGGPMELYQTDDGVTDGLRKPFWVPTLAEARSREASMNKKPEKPSPAPDPTAKATTPAPVAPVVPPPGVAGR